MIKNIWKILACIMAFGIFAYLVIVDYSAYQKQIDPLNFIEQKNKTEIDSAVVETEEETGTEVQTTAESVEKTTISETAVVLCLDQFNEVLYEAIYPFLKENQLTGVLVLEDGLLPGDYKKISTSQCKEMVADGWTVAVGESDDFDLAQNTEEVRNTFDEYLNEYLDRIRLRIGMIPKTYCFYEGEYYKSYEEILKKHGITGIRSFSEEENQQTEKLHIIKSIRLSEETELSDVIDEIQASDVIMLSMEVYTAELENAETEISMEHFKTILNQLMDEESIQFVSLEEAWEIVEQSSEE